MIDKLDKTEVISFFQQNSKHRYKALFFYLEQNGIDVKSCAFMSLLYQKSISLLPELKSFINDSRYLYRPYKSIYGSIKANQNKTIPNVVEQNAPVADTEQMNIFEASKNEPSVTITNRIQELLQQKNDTTSTSGNKYKELFTK